MRQQSLQQLQVFIEKQSARTAKERPQFQEMLAYCRKHHKNVSCVVVSDLSRLARNVADQATSIAELKRLNIKMVSVDEPMVDDTSAGKLAAGMLGVFNKIDNEERGWFPTLCNSDQFFNHGTVIFELGLLLTVQQ